jgi:hypothetical protein
MDASEDAETATAEDGYGCQWHDAEAEADRLWMEQDADNRPPE